MHRTPHTTHRPQIEKAQERAKLESMPKPLKPDQQAEVDGLRTQAKGG